MTSAWSFPGLAETAASNRDKFEEDRFVVLGKILDQPQLDLMREHFAAVFRGDYETGNLPDSSLWQEGTSFPHVPRFMANVWKSDLTFARFVLSSDLARAAAVLMRWDNVRLAQDTLWMKPPKWTEGAFHQDDLDFFEPAFGVTCWCTLDNACPTQGTLQYVRGSHLWPRPDSPLTEPSGAVSSRARMLAAATVAGISTPDVVPLDVPAGTLVAHRSETWHGSDLNQTHSVHRRAIGVHLLPGRVRFTRSGRGYIFGRYKRIGSDELDESFFPIIWSSSGYRTSVLDHYCHTGEFT